MCIRTTGSSPLLLNIRIFYSSLVDYGSFHFIGGKKKIQIEANDQKLLSVKWAEAVGQSSGAIINSDTVGMWHFGPLPQKKFCSHIVLLRKVLIGHEVVLFWSHKSHPNFDMWRYLKIKKYMQSYSLHEDRNRH